MRPNHRLYLAMFPILWHHSILLPLHAAPTNKTDKILSGFLAGCRPCHLKGSNAKQQNKV